MRKERLSSPYQLRLPKNLEASLKALADDTGKTMSAVMRECMAKSKPVFRARMPVAVQEDRGRALRFICKAGNNLNQIAQAVNELNRKKELDYEKSIHYLYLLDTIDARLRMLMDMFETHLAPKEPRKDYFVANPSVRKEGLSNPYQLRLSKSLEASLKALADDTGKTISAVMRERLASAKPGFRPQIPVAVQEDRGRALRFICKAGNNLNQIAHSFNELNLKGELDYEHTRKYLYLLDTIEARLRILTDFYELE